MSPAKRHLLEHRGARRAVLGFLLLLAASCTYILGKPDSLIFSHKKHAEDGAACDQCHADVAQSQDAGGRHLPKMATCQECHDDAFMKDCAKCHTQPAKPARAQVPGSDVIFSHKKHIEGVQAQCITCHPSVAAASDTAGLKLPDHDTCVQLCHGQQEMAHKSWISDMECYRCHKDLASKKLQNLTRWSHPRGYIRNHKEGAGRDLESCLRCHDQSFCADCHSKVEETKPELKFPDAVDRTFIHRADYESRHRIEVKTDQTYCWNCHGRSFCRDCHARKGVAPLDTAAGDKGTPDDPHAGNPGWVNTHGKVARRDIVQCAACHAGGDKTTDCSTKRVECICCHGPGGKNPHPPSWNPKVSKSSHTCQMCH